MYGYIETGAYQPPCRRRIAGVIFFAAAVRQGKNPLSRWRRRRVYRQLYRLGVRRCVMPDALRGEAERWGLLPVEVYPLRRCVLPQLLGKVWDGRCACAVLRAPYTDGAVWEAASVLARRVRYLALEIPQGAEVLALALRRRYGLCPGAVAHPALTVSFGGAPRDSRTVCLGEDCADYQTVTYRIPMELPPRCPAPEQMLQVLWEAEAVKKDDIEVKSVAARP